MYRVGVTVAALVVLAWGARCSEADIIHTSTFNGHTYHLLDTDGSKWWLDAEAEAVSLGGHLVTINDAAENQWVFDTFGPEAITYANANVLPDRGSISLWIGFSDHLAEGTYAWVSGESVGYTNWIAGEPAGGLGDDDFAGIAVNFFGPSGWHDIVGNTRLVDLPFGVVEVASPIPEPSSLALLGMVGLSLLGYGCRCRRKTELSA